jgi:hypothetical protein
LPNSARPSGTRDRTRPAKGKLRGFRGRYPHRVVALGVVCQSLRTFTYWKRWTLLDDAGRRADRFDRAAALANDDLGVALAVTNAVRSNRVGREGPAGQPGPSDRALALARAAFVVERDNVLGRSRDVGDDEAGARGYNSLGSYLTLATIRRCFVQLPSMREPSPVRLTMRP